MRKATGLRWSFTFASIIYLILGLFLLIAPNASTRLLCTIIGLASIAYGALNVLSFALGRQSVYTFELLTGVGLLAFGLFSIINPGFLTNFLFIVLGIVIMVEAAGGIRRALNLRRLLFYYWWGPMLLSVAAFLLALSFILYPSFYGNTLMMAIGLLLILQSAGDLFAIYRLSRLSSGNE